MERLGITPKADQRVAVPGVRRGLRYLAVAGSPTHMNRYEVDDLAA